MKPIIFSLALAALVAGCSDPIVDIPSDSVEQHLFFDVSFVVDDDPVLGWESSGSAFIDNPSVGDSAWILTLVPFYTSSSADQAAKVRIETDGAFSFAFIHDGFGGYQDSIVGSGWFSSDTLYLSYTYRELESGNFGSVSVWSH